VWRDFKGSCYIGSEAYSLLLVKRGIVYVWVFWYNNQEKNKTTKETLGSLWSYVSI